MAELYPLPEAARIIGIEESVLKGWIAEGRARAMKRSGELLLRPREVRRLAAEHTGRQVELPLAESGIRQERRRGRGRRKADYVEMDVLVEALEKSLDKVLVPVQRVQVRMLERLEEVQRRVSSGNLEELQARLQEREEEVLRLREELEALRSSREEVERLQARLEESRVEMRHLERDRARLEGDLEGAIAALEKARRSEAKVKELLSVSEADRRELQSRLEELKHLREKVRKLEKIDEQYRVDRALEARCSLLESEVARLEKQLEELDRLRSQLAEVAAERDRSEEQVRELRAELELKASHAARVEEELHRRTRQVATLSEHLEQARQELERVRERNLEARLAELEKERDELKEQAASLQEEVKARNATLKRAAQDYEAVQERARQAEEKLKSLTYRMEMAAGEASGPTLEDSRAMLDEIARLRSAMEEKDRLIQEGHRERSQLREQVEESRRQLYELQNRFEQEKREWSELLARELQGRQAARLEKPEERMSGERPRGWRLFKRRSETG